MEGSFVPAQGGGDSSGSSSASASGSRRRDAAVEDEIFHCGYFADVVFKFRSTTGEVEEVYGQRALFSLLSPALRSLLLPGGVAGDGVTAKADQRECWLDPRITARAFREVARYVYGLAPRMGPELVLEVLRASTLLGTAELEEAAIALGLAQLRGAIAAGSAASDNSSQDGAVLGIEDALRCLEWLLTVEPRRDVAGAWREATLGAFSAEQILACISPLHLAPAALREMLLGEALHGDPCRLWRVCLDWAHALAMPADGSPAPSPRADPTPPRGPPAPRRLFGQRAHLKEALAPQAPCQEEVEWQKPLLEVVDLVRFWQMTPVDFAAHVEALGPALPALRQAIYLARRRGVREGAAQAA